MAKTKIESSADTFRGASAALGRFLIKGAAVVSFAAFLHWFWA